jgi:hypothetical protein
VLSAPAFAGDIENSLETRWRGAWVVTAIETYSDCAGLATNNRVNGNLVSSRGRTRFRSGEIAKVERIDVKRSRIDLHVMLAEPLLAARKEGPFTLYDERRCTLELQIEIPRSQVAAKDAEGIDAALKPVLERYPTQDEAQRARTWNHRKRDPYPADYQQTLADYAVWKAEQANAAVQARLDKAQEEAARLVDRLSDDHDYLKGFAAGVERMRSVELTECRALMAADFAGLERPAAVAAAAQSEAQQRWSRGHQDGQRLVLALTLMRGLPKCFVPVGEAR